MARRSVRSRSDTHANTPSTPRKHESTKTSQLTAIRHGILTAVANHRSLFAVGVSCLRDFVVAFTTWGTWGQDSTPRRHEHTKKEHCFMVDALRAFVSSWRLQSQHHSFQPVLQDGY